VVPDPEGNQTQWVDALQRANFNQQTQTGGINPNYHVLLSAATPGGITITVPDADTTSQPGATCGTLSGVDLTWFFNNFPNIVSNLVDLTTTGTTLPAWTSLSGVLAATPAPVATSTSLSAFDTNPAGSLWDQQFTTSWGGWNGLRGVLSTGPVTVGEASNADAFGLNSTGSLWYQQWNGTSFGAWTNLGGTLPTS
jgi:hypothetical protein